jgi:hypothetical protein
MDAVPPQAGLRSNLRAMPPAARVLFAGTFVNRLGTFVLPFFTLYLTGAGSRPHGRASRSAPMGSAGSPRSSSRCGPGLRRGPAGEG